MLYEVITSAVSGPLTFPGTPVSEGVFTVVLTFPAAAFDGTARFLEIEVRTGADPFEVLSPRQRLSYNFV